MIYSVRCEYHGICDEYSYLPVVPGVTCHMRIQDSGKKKGNFRMMKTLVARLPNIYSYIEITHFPPVMKN